MKVKIVLSLFAVLVFLASCGAKNDTESGVKTNDSGAVEQEEDVTQSSSIGGGQGAPAEGDGVEVFRN